MTAIHTTVESPIGELTVVADEGRLIGLYFPHHWSKPDRSTFGPRTDTGFDGVKRQLGEYFAGTRQRFDVPLDARGDEFQHRVWGLIDRIPYGQTATYGELARELGDPALAKDVGVAVARNPLCVIVACHRVVGRDGKLTGYAGGLTRKRSLLALEVRAAQRSATLF